MVFNFLLQPTNGCRGQIQKYFEETKKCVFTIGREETSFKHMSFIVAKSSPYIEGINKEYKNINWMMLISWQIMLLIIYYCRSLRWFSSGLRDYWRNKAQKFPKQCQLDYNQNGVSLKRASHRLNLKQFSIPFFILICGYALGFIQFLFEISYSFLCQRKRPKITK